MELWFLFFSFFCLIKSMYEDNLPSPDNLETMALTSEVGCRRAEIVGIHSSIHSVHTVLMSGSLYSLLVYPVKEEQNHLTPHYKLSFLLVTTLKFLNKTVNTVSVDYNTVLV